MLRVLRQSIAWLIGARRPTTRALLGLALCCGSVQAQVLARSETGFVSEHVLLLAAPPLVAYRALTEEVHAWWDAAHSYSGAAQNFSLDARPGGCFCETLPGGGVEHMRVVHAAPGQRLQLVGGLGPLQELGASGTMSFVLRASDTGTELRYRYVVNGSVPDALLPGGLAALAEPVDQVQLGQLKRLQAYLQAAAAEAADAN